MTPSDLDLDLGAGEAALSLGTDTRGTRSRPSASRRRRTGSGSRRRSTRSRTGRSIAWLCLALIAFSTIYPILFLIFASMKSESGYASNSWGPPTSHASLHLFTYAWTHGEFGRYLSNSALVVLLAVVLAILTSSMAAFAFAKLEFRFKRVVFFTVLCLLMVPHALTVVPIFQAVNSLHLINSRVGLALVYSALTLPFDTYLLTQYMQGIPKELFDAARVDGAGRIRIFWSLVLPLARPALLTVALLDFMNYWNDLIYSLVLLQDDSKRTVTVGLSLLQGDLSTPVPLQAASMLLSMLPVLVVFFIFQRRLAEGLTAGAIK